MRLPHDAAHPIFAARARRRRSTTTSLTVGMAASALLHLLALQTRFPLAIGGPPATNPISDDSKPSNPTLQVLQILIDDERGRPVNLEISGLQELADIRIDASFLPPRPGAPGHRPTTAEAVVPLRDRMRTTIPFAPLPRNRSLETAPTLDVARERVARDIHFFNDSVAKAEESYRKSRDWTGVNDRGERWGLSVARLNLGKYAIPLQYDTTEDVFRSPLERREEYQKRILLFWETERQVLRAGIDAQIRSSLREIRARTDAKRDSIRRRGRDER